MSETEFENESSVAIAEPPAEKPEKPVRKTTRKPKAEKAAAPVAVEEETPAAVAEVADVAPEEPVVPIVPIVDVENDAPIAESPSSAPPHLNKRGEQTQAAETLDIRVLKEMKLPDLTKIAKEHGIEQSRREISSRL